MKQARLTVMLMHDVFIADYELYIPETFMDYKELASLTGLPDWVVKDKLGIVRKPIERKLSVSEMAKLATSNLMQRHRDTKVDLVLYAASDFKDKYVWDVAPSVMSALAQQGFDLRDTYGADISMQCVSSIVALDLIKPKFTITEGTKNALMVMATKQSLIVDYKDESSTFMYDFSDGAAAVLLSNERGRYKLLNGSIITDGKFSDVVYQMMGERFYESHSGSYLLHVERSKEFNKEFESISLSNMVRVITEAVERSGFSTKDIDYLAILHMKRSFHRKVLDALGLGKDKSIYLENFGHMQSIDPFLSLWLAEREGKVREGNLIVLVSAGTGWTWGAYAIQRVSGEG